MSVRPDGRVFEVLALAEVDAAWGLARAATRRLAGTLIDGPRPLSPIDELMLALACERLGMKEEAERLARRAERRPPSDVPTAAFLLQLQAARGGETADAVRFLLSQRRGKGWRTTIESAWAVLGLVGLLDRPTAGEYAAPGRLSVVVNDAAVKEMALPGRADPAFDSRISVPEPPAGWGGKVVVRLSFDGRGTAFYTATLAAMLGGEDPAPVKRGLEIVREYLEKEGDGWKPVEGTLRAGRTALVHLEIRSPAAREYVMVTDPRPDGFEAVERPAGPLAGRRQLIVGLSDEVDLSAGWEARLEEFRGSVRGDAARESSWAKALLGEIVARRRFGLEAREEEFALPPGSPAEVEHRDDRTIFYLSALPAGSTHLYYFVRPELAGKVHAMPPQATPMYEPEIYGAGTETRLEVAAGAAASEAARRLDPAPGVAGLPQVFAALDRIDADELISLVPSKPRIGNLLVRVCGEPALRAWLAAEASTKAAGSDLRERIEAARRDLATRRLCADALADAPPSWLAAIEEALASDLLAGRVLEGATVAEAGALDNVLLWVQEDRAFRMLLLEAAQRLRGTAEVGRAAFRPVTVERVVASLGPQAPAGDALVRWKLAQQGSFPHERMAERAGRLERELSIPVKLAGGPDLTLPADSGRVSVMLDRGLAGTGVYYRVREGGLRIGPLEEIMK